MIYDLCTYVWHLSKSNKLIMLKSELLWLLYVKFALLRTS